MGEPVSSDNDGSGYMTGGGSAAHGGAMPNDASSASKVAMSMGDECCMALRALFDGCMVMGAGAKGGGARHIDLASK